MNVTVYYMAQLKQAAGVGSETIELAGPCTATELVRLLADRHGPALRRLLLNEGGEMQPTILLFVNDVQVMKGNDVMFQDGDEVSFLSPIAGG
jgi:molybdopterin converting factor small subunit